MIVLNLDSGVCIFLIYRGEMGRRGKVFVLHPEVGRLSQGNTLVCSLEL